MSVDLLIAYARTGMAHKQAPTLEEVQALVRALAASPLLATPVSEAEIEHVIKQVECEFLVNLGPARYLTAKNHKPWLKAKSHEIDFRYWRRYRNYLVQSGFGPNVVKALGEVTDNLLDLAGDPTIAGEWSRRGLVVGHVQSGKTANYVGLINKAADAGYKLIILIAGIHSNLRSQTQERIDQGFVGRDSDQLLSRQTNANFLGVGALDRSFSAVAYTSRAHDFLKVRADGLGISINNLSQPAIFVIKKHKSILTNLIEWLKGTSATGDKLTMPMLVIDDEADNASVNTAADPDRPNAINSLIRTLLSISTKNTYVGYTATPFANIFIDPDTTQELFGDDLFPRDFIVGLDAPSNYVGARSFFLADGGDPLLTIELDDTDSWLPITHKIETAVDYLHESLLRAIDCFVLSKAIRILRGQGAKHHSMLVNVSRFTGVQGRVCARIQDRVVRLKDAIENRHGLPVEIALRDPLMHSLHNSWETAYRSCPEQWPDIQRALHQAAAGVVVVEVNARSGPGALDYRSHADTGLNVIAVGGNSLSRGFTLEGLTISYFLRNTQMYDTLLQMGRWFGYRDGYADLCRLFIRPEALEWYAYITEAADELRSEIRRMESLKLTPKDFGLAVRAHPDSLLVTARNKMRTAKEIVREVGLANRLVESAVVLGSNGAVGANWERMEGFVSRLLTKGIPIPVSAATGLQSQLFKDVPNEVVLDFIAGFLVHPGNLEMQTEPLTEYIRRRGFQSWDVVVASSSLAAAKEHTIGGMRIGLQERFALPLGGGRSGLQISGRGRRVASRGLEAVGLSEAEHLSAIEEWKTEYEAGNAGKNIADHFYRSARSRPLLMVHFLDVMVRNGDETAQRERHAAYGISFSPLRRGETEQRVTYKANVVAYRELFGQMDADGDEDDVVEE